MQYWRHTPYIVGHYYTILLFMSFLPIAIIDLGTNTFHLVIINPQADNPYQPIKRQREFVKLGEGGGTSIIPAAFERGITTLQSFAQVIEQYNIAPSRVYAIATEGLRKADNSAAFIHTVQQQCGINIRCISGNDEALFIYYGIRQAVQVKQITTLYIDIGGGSTEFILANDHEIFWKQSFRLGASVLKAQFHAHDRLAPSELQALNEYLAHSLLPLWEACEQWKPHYIIGSSGTFDTIVELQIAALRAYRETMPAHSQWHTINRSYLEVAYWQVTHSTLAELTAMPGMEARRAELMPVSIALVYHVYSYLQRSKGLIQMVAQSNYAIKEGIIWAVLHQPELLAIPTEHFE